MRSLIRQIVDRLIAGLKLGLILVALTALVAAGASSALRLQPIDPVEPSVETLAEQASLDPDPTDLDSASRNMNPGNPPNGEPMAIIGQFILSGGMTHDQARTHRVGLSNEGLCLVGSTVPGRTPVASIGMVSSRLARQFTLVGAKPDGTG